RHASARGPRREAARGHGGHPRPRRGRGDAVNDRLPARPEGGEGGRAGTRMGLQPRSTGKKEGIVKIPLASVPTPEPKPEEVVVRIDASPINPSDQGLLFGGADLTTVKASGPADNPVVTASIAPAGMKALAGRLDQSLPVG